MISEEEIIQIAELDKTIAIGSAIEYLKQIPEFQLIIKHYTEDMVLDLTYSLATIEKDSSNTDNVARRLEAIALFKQFLITSVDELQDAVITRQRILDNGDA